MVAASNINKPIQPAQKSPQSAGFFIADDSWFWQGRQPILGSGVPKFGGRKQVFVHRPIIYSPAHIGLCEMGKPEVSKRITGFGGPNVVRLGTIYILCYTFTLLQ